MNRRIKKKKRRIVPAKIRKRNKQLCKRYPFLIPRNVWSDRIVWERDKGYVAKYGHKDYERCKKYSCTLADEFGAGWWKAFGLLLCEELREDLIKCGYLYKFRFVQIKEKFGELRAYFGGIPMESKADKIISKYEYLSNYICEFCGKPNTYQINWRGWITTICKDCYEERCKKMKRYYHNDEPYESLTNGMDDPTLPRIRKISRYSKNGNEVIEYDISETVEKILNNWRGDET